MNIKKRIKVLKEIVWVIWNFKYLKRLITFYDILRTGLSKEDANKIINEIINYEEQKVMEVIKNND